MLRTQITLGILLMIASVVTFAFIFATEEARMAVESEAVLARRIENGAQLFHTNCERCHGENAVGIPGLCPPLNSLTLLEQRVEETGWAGSVHSYIVHTIAGGRLTSTRPDQYVGSTSEGMAMPFWGQEYGGPLRADQIEDIAYFLENYGETELVEEPEEEIVISPDADVVEAGLALYQQQGCVGCHQLEAAGAVGTVGPTHENLAAIAAERIEDPNYTGEATTAAEYILESIVNPGQYVVEGYPNAMPAYPNLSEEQLGALVEMLMTVTSE